MTDLERATDSFYEIVNEEGEEDGVYIPLDKIQAVTSLKDEVAFSEFIQDELWYRFPSATNGLIPNSIFYSANDVRRAMRGERMMMDIWAPLADAYADPNIEEDELERIINECLIEQREEYEKNSG